MCKQIVIVESVLLNMVLKNISLLIGGWLLVAATACTALAQDEEGDVAISSSEVAGDTLPGNVRNVPTNSPDPESKANSFASNAGNRRSTINDQDTALEAARKGLVLPFGKVLKTVKKNAPGDVVKVRLIYRLTGMWTYEVTVLDSKGRYTKLSLNARSGALISKSIR
jgi:uncharacterized membrane protein YkoI